MANDIPTQCKPLTNLYVKTSITWELLATGCIATPVKQSDLLATVSAAYDVDPSPAEIVNAVNAAGMIAPNVSLTKAAGYVDAAQLLASARENTFGWSCCFDPKTGEWYGYHARLGWDRTRVCAT